MEGTGTGQEAAFWFSDREWCPPGEGHETRLWHRLQLFLCTLMCVRGLLIFSSGNSKLLCNTIPCCLSF